MVSQVEAELIRQSIFGTAAIEGTPLSQEEVSGIIASGEASSNLVTKSEVEIRNLVKAYVEWVNSEELTSLGPFVRAALAHYHFSLIHPFFGGNGRDRPSHRGYHPPGRERGLCA